MQFSMFQFSFINLSGLEGICDGVGNEKNILASSRNYTFSEFSQLYALHSLDRTVWANDMKNSDISCTMFPKPR